MKSFKIILGTIAMMVALVLSTNYSNAAPAAPVLVEEGALTGSDSNKLPSVAVGNGEVNIGWGINKQANFADRPEAGGTFNKVALGNVGNNSTYFNVDVAVSANQTTHVAWIQDGTTVLYRNRVFGQPFGGALAIAGGLNFANGVSIAVQGNNNIFVSWRTASGGINFVVSGNGGVNWSAPADVPLPVPAYAGVPSLAANSSNTVILTWTGTDGNVYVGQWNGSNFSITSLTGPGKHDYFNPTAAVSPSGVPYVAWRSVAQGVYYSERQPNGTWGISNVFVTSGTAGPVAINVDSNSDIHLAWASNPTGTYQIYYAIKTPGNNFSNPIIVSRDGTGYKVNVDVAASVSNGVATAHIVWESFVGGQFIRYARVNSAVDSNFTPTPTPVTPTATPVLTPVGTVDLNNAANYTTSRNVTARIHLVSGTATSFSITGATPASGTFTPDANGNMDVSLVLDTAQCQQTVTVVLSGPSGSSQPFSDSIVIDADVQATVTARNINLADNNRPVVGIAPQANGSDYGDPGYTRTSYFLVLIDPKAAECSGLKDYIIGGKGETAIPTATDSRWKAIVPNTAVGASIPSDQPEGTYSFKVFVRDNAGYYVAEDAKIIFDQQEPVSNLRSAVPTTTTTPDGDVVDLDLSNLQVTDNLYSGGYWGYWVMVNTDPSGAISSDDWNKYGVVVPGHTGSTLHWNLSLGSNPDTLRAGQTYYVHIRFIDGAGNVSGQKSPPVNSQAIHPTAFTSVLKIYMPYVAK